MKFKINLDKTSKKTCLIINVMWIQIQFKMMMNLMNMKMNKYNQIRFKYIVAIFNHKIIMKLAVTEIFDRPKHYLKTLAFCIKPANIQKTHVMTIQTRRNNCFMSVETKIVIPIISLQTNWIQTQNLHLQTITIIIQTWLILLIYTMRL